MLLKVKNFPLRGISVPFYSFQISVLCHSLTVMENKIPEREIPAFKPSSPSSQFFSDL